MLSPISISNRALAQIRAGTTIASLDENSVEANACGQFYEVARDTALAAYRWAFARRYLALALLPNVPPAGFKLAYRYPNDCIEAISIRPMQAVAAPIPLALLDGGECTAGAPYAAQEARDTTGWPFDVASDDVGQIVLTNAEQAVLEYTTRVEDPAQWSVPFQQVVVFLLASYIAIPVTGKQELATANMNLYKDALPSARLHSVAQGFQDPLVPASGVEARR